MTRTTRMLATAVLALTGCSEAARSRIEPWPDSAFSEVQIRAVTSADVLFMIDDS